MTYSRSFAATTATLLKCKELKREGRDVDSRSRVEQVDVDIQCKVSCKNEKF